MIPGRVVPVARGLDATTAGPLVEALTIGGLQVVEITVEGSGGLDAVRSVAGGPITVGAGTVMSVGAAEAAVDAGATFLVSPHWDLSLADWARDAAVTYIPGVMTPSEAAAAAAHVELVKLFPAGSLGPGYLRALRAPMPELRVMATGGIDATNAASFFQAGAEAIGVGGWLTGHRDMGLVAERAAEILSVVV